MGIRAQWPFHRKVDAAHKVNSNTWGEHQECSCVETPCARGGSFRHENIVPDAASACAQHRPLLGQKPACVWKPCKAQLSCNMLRCPSFVCSVPLALRSCVVVPDKKAHPFPKR